MSGKLNPLFIDSTKGFGESVGTRIELTGLCLKDGESAHICIRDGQGRDQLIGLIKENESYTGRIWLTHQQIITYQFLVQLEGQTIASSMPRQIQASHMILDQWHPLRDESIADAEPTCPVTEAEAIGSTTKSLRNYSTFSQVFPETETFEELIDKWGL